MRSNRMEKKKNVRTSNLLQTEWTQSTRGKMIINDFKCYFNGIVSFEKCVFFLHILLGAQANVKP